ncbi:MAG: malectin domain-containing carbohydrate-binding protein [Janthinobacterium lividum]
MVGGLFQGSSDNSTWTTLYTVSTAPTDAYTSAALTIDPRIYRYLRYLGPSGSYGDVTEIEFDSGTGTNAVKLTGTGFGTAGSYNNNGNVYGNALDGNSSTYFDAPSPGNGDYVGIDQGAGPNGLAATAGNASASLSWGTVAGASGYNVYRATVSGGPYTKVNSSIVMSTSYSDTGLTNGTTYYYAVTVLTAGGESAYSSSTSVAPVASVAALPAQVLAINAGGGTASPYSADSGFSGGGTYSSTAAITTTGITSPAPQTVYQTERNANSGNFTYTLPGLTAGASYTLRLHFAELYFTAASQREFNVSVNGTSVLTNFDIFAAAGKNTALVKSYPAVANSSSQIVVAFTNGAVNYAKVDGLEVLGTPSASPSGLVATAGNANVSLSWSAVSGVSGYNVYRATASGGPFAKINGSVVFVTNYTDSTVTNGTTYYYVVTALSAGGESSSSNTASALPVVPASDFSVSASPNALSIPQGSSKATMVSLTNTGGFSSSVVLTASGLPTGVTATFAPTSISGTTASTLTLTVGATAATGAATVTITGTSGSTAHTATVSLTVTANPILTSIVVSPPTASLNLNGSQPFTAVAKDQNGTVLTTQPTFTWSVASGVGTIVGTTGVYSAGTAAGSASVKATSGTVSGPASVTVTNAAPTVATAASATPSPVTATTTALSVLGADDGGESNLTYTWATTGTPPAAVAFSANGTNAAKNTTATFTKAGSYGFQVTIKDAGGLSTTSAASVVVNATPTSIAVSPPTATLALNATQPFAGTVQDQFGTALATQPTVSWSVSGGGGVSPATGATTTYTAPATAPTGAVTVSAASGSAHGTAMVTVSSLAALSSVTVNPVSVTGSNSSIGTVTLNSNAPAGGAKVLLSSSSPSAVVPSTITVPAGSLSAPFTITTSPVTASTAATITGTYSGQVKQATLTIVPAVLAAVSVLPTSVTGGISSQGTVTLTGNAPAGGLTVVLSSSLTAATVPASIAVPAGSQTATFAVTTYPVSAAAAPVIQGTLGGSKSATLAVVPPVVSALSMFPVTILSNSSSTGTVTLAGRAPSSGVTVSLSSSNTAAATVPASIFINSGASTGTFKASSHAVASNTPVTITATANGSGKTETLNVNLPGSYYADAPAPDWAMGTIPTDSDIGSDGAGPASSMGVDLASGVEEVSPGADLWAYNSVGPSTSYERLYRSSIAAAGYASPGLSPGWTDSYDLYVVPVGSGFTLHYNTGATEGWTGTSGTLTTNGGVPYLAKAPSSTTLTMTFKDRSVYTFTQEGTASANYAAGTYLLTKITNLVGHSIFLVRDIPANNYRLTSVQNDAASPVTLLSFSYDANGHLLALQDLASPNTAEHRQVSYTFGLASDPGLTKPVLTAVSQIEPVGGNANALWKYDYQAISGMPFLNTATCPDPSDPSGATYTSALASYDPAGHVQSQVDTPDGSGRQHLYNYRAGATDEAYLNNDASQTTAYADTMNLNANNTVAGVTDAANNSAHISYFASGTSQGPYLPHVVTNRLSQSVTTEYDTAHTSGNTFGNVVSVTDPRGTSINYVYLYPSDFSLGELSGVQEVNVTGSVSTAKQPTTMDYFAAGDGVYNGLLKDVVSPLPGYVDGTGTVTTTYAYTGTSASSLGDLLSVTTIPTKGAAMLNNAATSRTAAYNYTSVTDSAIGYTYTQASEAIGEPTSVTVTGGGTTDTTVSYYQYDGRGNTTATIDGIGNRTDLLYNAADQLVEVLYPATNPMTPTARAYLLYSYQYLGGPAKSVTLYDESGSLLRQSSYVYGKSGETLSVSDLKGLVSSYSYDGCFRVATVSDGNLNTTSYSYDSIGNLKQEHYPNPGNLANPYDTLNYTYDSDQNLTKRVDGNNSETDYNRDTAVDSRLTSMTYPAAAASNVYYGYDPLERENSIAIGPSGSPNVAKSYIFDDLDSVLTQKVSFAGGPQNDTFTYSYYADGSRQQLATRLGTYGYQYDGIGRLTQATFPWAGGFASHTYERNGWLKRTVGPRTQTDYAYNARGFLIGLRNTAVQDHLLLSDFLNMTYDGAGNRLTESAELPALGNAPDASRAQSYSYDSRDELSEDKSVPDLFTYNGTDPYSAHHDQSFNYDLAQNPLTFRSMSTSHNADNQLSGSGFGFDGNGNPTTYMNSAANFSFDPENRLTNITAPMAFSATYDGDGLRASKTAAGATTYYLYDGETPLLEETQSGATTTVTAGNGEAADGWRGRYYPGSVKFGGSTDYGKQYYEYLYDPQGNLVQRQSQNNQATDVQDTVLYDAYGNPSSDLDAATGTAEAYKDPVGFGGQHGYYTDPETGLQLLTNRYYDSGQGRFINRDPIGYKGGINLYGFTGNNPVNEMDPDGTDQLGINPSQYDLQRTAGMDWLDHRGTETYTQAYNKASAAEVLAFNKHQRENQRNFDIEVTVLSLAYGGGEVRGLYAGGRGLLAAIAARQAAKTIAKEVAEDEGETFVSFFHKGLLDNPTKPLSTGTSEEDVAAVIKGDAPIHEFRVPSRVFLKWQQEQLATTARTSMNGRTITEWVFRKGAKQQMLNEFRIIK